MSRRIFGIGLLLSILFFSCKKKEVTGVVMHPTQQTEKAKENPYIKGNKRIVQLENEEIDLFLKRYGWKTEKTNTGLRIEITHQNPKGKSVFESDTVRLKYRILLLNGEEIYHSDQDGEKVFVVEKSEEMTGLHEAVKLMRKGEQARLIIPSHLAYGASGDGDKIDAYTPLALWIELKDN